MKHTETWITFQPKPSRRASYNEIYCSKNEIRWNVFAKTVHVLWHRYILLLKKIFNYKKGFKSQVTRTLDSLWAAAFRLIYWQITKQQQQCRNLWCCVIFKEAGVTHAWYDTVACCGLEAANIKMHCPLNIVFCWRVSGGLSSSYVSPSPFVVA